MNKKSGNFKTIGLDLKLTTICVTDDASQMDNINFDCKYFMSDMPCLHNKLNNSECEVCSYYTKIGKRILIIKLRAIGDVIRTTPIITKLKLKYPNSQISWLTCFPSVLPKDKIDKIYNLDYISLYNLTNKEFDIAINLDKDEEACTLLSNVKAKKKYGFKIKNGHIAPATKHAEHKLITGFFDEKSKQNTKHYIQEIFEICEMKFEDEPCLINLNIPLAEKWKLNLTAKAGQKSIIGLNTGCGTRWQTRLWNEKKWIELIKQLQKNDCFPMLLGGEAEDSKNQYLSKETGCFYPGTFTLEEFIAVSDSASVIVTQVTMMMHIAVALQKRIVLMNNIFNKHEFYLYNKGVIIEPTKKCECYYGNTCIKGESCMKYIETQKVFDNVLNLLKNTEN